MRLNFAAALRRATRLTRKGRPVAATKAVQKAVSVAMVKTAMASLSMVPAIPTGKPTAKKKRSVTRKARPKRVLPAASVGARQHGLIVKQLRAVQAALPSAGMRPAGSSPTKAPTLPKGSQYLDRTHSCPAGTRDFKLFLPARQPRGPKGLIVMLHGCSQDPNDFATGTNMNRVAQRHGLAVAYPTQTTSDNAGGCWNWFLPASQRRGRGEPEILAGIALSMMGEFGLMRDQIFVAGLSAGGAMAAILADTYGDVFSAVGVHSGLPRGSANNVISALSVMRTGGKARRLQDQTPRAVGKHLGPVRRIIFQGDADTTVHPSNAVQITRGAVGGRKPATVSVESGSGRDYRHSTYRLPDGSVDLELWQIKGAGHAWSGGKSGGSFTESKGPDASAEMVRFFLSAAR